MFFGEDLLFGLSIGEYPQTLSAIIHGKRRINTSLALSIEEALGMEQGTLMLILVYHDIKKEEIKKHEKVKPDPNCLKGKYWELIKLDMVEAIEKYKIGQTFY